VSPVVFFLTVGAILLTAGVVGIVRARRRARAAWPRHVAGALDLVRPPLDALSVARHTDEEW
jgi:uncharacterized membrane protein HdeD (DUF308 family)